MKPICVQCQRFYSIERTGFYFIEGMPISSMAPPGKAAPERWRPYKLWAGDLWKCKGCGAQTIAGVPSKRLAEHYEPGFADKVNDLGATFQVNDC